MSEWQTFSIGELTVNHDSKRKPVKEADRKPGPYPYYGASGIVDYVDDYLFDGDFLLIAEDGENLRSRQTPIAFMAKGKSWVNNHAHIVTANEKADTLFLMYALQIVDISGYLTGAVMPKLTQGNLNRIQITCPKIEEQRVIARILGSLDDKIELNRQINRILEEMAQAIFKSWFVDFDPVKAKMAAIENGEDPERAAMRAISGKSDEELDALPHEQFDQLAATAALFPSAITNSPLGPIPEGWQCSTIGEEVEIVGGGTPSTKVEEFWEGGEFHWTTPKDLSGLPDKVLLSTERKVTQAGLEKVSSGLLQVDTVLMSSRAPVGYLALAKVPTAINQGFIAMKCTKRLTPEFVIQWATSVMDDIKQRASGSTFAEISKKTFRPMTIIVPPMDLLSEYKRNAKGFYDKITAGALETASLCDLRDVLLPKLLSGELPIEGLADE